MFNSKRASSGYTGSVFNLPKDFQIHRQLPPLMVGYDTETTGLDTSNDEPISYGLVVYRNGVQTGDKEHYLVNASTPSNAGAEEVHGWGGGKLHASYNGEIVSGKKDGRLYKPAIDPTTGMNYMARRLANLQKQGAVFVTANGPKFDLDMLKNVHRKFNHNILPLQASGFDPSKARVVDVIAHDNLMVPKALDPRSRSLTNLSLHYGVEPGNHAAYDDARATVDVFMKQIEDNKKYGRGV